MAKTTQQVLALKLDIQKWIESSKDADLAHDTHWRDVGAHFQSHKSPLHADGHRVYTALGLPGGEPIGDSHEVYLVLCPGGDMHSALQGNLKEWDPRDYFDELEAIIDKHGFWWEFEDDAILLYSLD